MELDIKVFISIIGTAVPLVIAGIIAFQNLKNVYKDELRKTEKEFSDRIEKQNEKIGLFKDKLNEQNVEFEKLKAKDENQQQIINQLDKLVYEIIPSLTSNINPKSRGKND